MSFTVYSKGHKIYAGPERASRYLQSSLLKNSEKNPGGIPSRDLSKTIEYYLQKTQIKNVHNNPPKRSLLTLDSKNIDGSLEQVSENDFSKFVHVSFGTG